MYHTEDEHYQQYSIYTQEQIEKGKAEKIEQGKAEGIEIGESKVFCNLIQHMKKYNITDKRIKKDSGSQTRNLKNMCV